MKIKKGWGLFAAVILVLIVLGDVGLSRHQEKELREKISGASIIGVYADRVRPGMTKPTVEAMIDGYRQYSIFEAGDQITYTYRYWFGFIPPIRGLKYKSVGSLSVTYDRSGVVVSSTHWMR